MSARCSAARWRLRIRRVVFAMLGLALVASVTVVGAFQEDASAQTDLDTTMLLFDLSGSMGQFEPDGRTRLAVAQQAMVDAIGGIDPGSKNIGIRSFSNCGVTTLEQAPAPVDQSSLAATINSFTPDAQTDIAAALSAVAGDFGTATGRNSVVLLSDGAHNCTGDPCQTASGLIAAGIDIVVHAIGIGTAGTTAEDQLSCIAEVTGGTVVSVAGADELFDAIDQAFVGSSATSAVIEYQIPTCINSAMVQNDPTLATSSLGDSYRDSVGTSRVLVSGQECDFNCNGGYDINCDGVLGDFCDSDYDLETVQGVGECLKEIGAAPGQAGSPGEIVLLEKHCVDVNNVGGFGLADPAEIADACSLYREFKKFQGRADDARSNGDTSHGDYNQTLADDAFAKADSLIEIYCAAEPADAPTQRASGFDWAMDHRISGDDGLVLTNVFLGQRKMAERISIPYLTVRSGGASVRVELIDNLLLGDCPGALSRSRLVRSSASPDDGALRIVATYLIDQIEGLDGTLTVTQRYEFDPERREGRCEPSAFAPAPAPIDPRKLPCSPFRLAVDYEYSGSGDFVSIEVPQRMHFKVEDRSNNTGVALLDRDSAIIAALTLGNPIARTFAFDVERIVPALADGQQAPDGPFDNYHQTFLSEVRPPTGVPAAPGCPECVHIHWRWSDEIKADGFFGPGGPGSPLIPAGSTQSLRIGVSRFEADELDPPSYDEVINDQPVGNAGGDPVLWYISSSINASDTFFGHEGRGGGFFSVGYTDLDVRVTPSSVIVPADERRTPVTVQLRNLGPGVAENVDLTIDVDDGQVFDADLPDGCQLSGGSADIVCSWQRYLAGDEPVVLRFDVEKLDSTPGAVTVVAKSKSDIVEFAEGNDVGLAVITTADFADLQLEGSAGAVSGDRLRYNVTVRNEQTGEARDVFVTVRLPGAVDGAAVDFSEAPGCSLSSQAVVICDFANIPGQTSQSISFWTPAAGQSGSVAVATVTTVSPDLDETNNSIELSIN